MDQNYQEAANILVKWGATSVQIEKILPPCSNCNLTERVNCVLSIEKHLKILFENPKNQNGFMTMKNNNEYFSGRTPLSIISDGSLIAIQDVAKRISALVVLW